MARLDHPSPEHAERTARKRILIADDNRDSADSLAMLLEIDGYAVVVERDGPGALAAFERFAPHVVVLDIGMPGMDGYEVASAIRLKSKSAVLIAITGWGQQTDKERAQAAGFDYHFTKPVEPEELMKVLRGR